MASDDHNTVLALLGAARCLDSRLAPRPAGSGADRVRQGGDASRDPYDTPKALAQRASLTAAMIRSRSGENRRRRDRVSGGAARRALPILEDTADAETLPIVAVEETLIERAAIRGGRPARYPR